MADGSGSFDLRGGRDPAALAAVYRAHAAYVWRVLRHCGVPVPDLDDAVQETFLVVFRRLPEFEARASLRTWIYAVAVRVASTRRRSQRREAARREHAGRRMHGVGAVDPEVELSKAEAADLVDRLLDELDATKRTVFVLAELEGVKVPEISRILGVNPRTVHSRLRLARESFGSALRRLQAHEEGNRRVARLRPRPLLEQAANDRPPAVRRKAVMAALAVRIEQGAMPALPGWASLSLGSGWLGAWGLPAAVIGAVGLAVAVAVGAPEMGTKPGRDVPPSAPATTEPSHFEPPPSHAATDPSQFPLLPSHAATDPSQFPLLPSHAATNPSQFPPLASHAATDSSQIPPPPSHAATDSSQIPPPPSRAATQPSRIEPPPSPAAADATASSLAAETLLLEQARSALRRGDHDAALAALDAHAAEHPRGLLLDEARSTRLRALCAAGRSAEATALAEQWAPARASSRWHDVVASACR